VELIVKMSQSKTFNFIRTCADVYQEVRRGRGELSGGSRVKRRLIAVATAVLSTVLIGGVAVQPAAAADPVPTTVTLPLFGVPFTVDITTGPGGALANVAVTSANSTVATELKPRKVVFESSNAAGDTAKVVVKSKHGGQSVSARAGTLAQVSGPGSWSGDLFGTGSATSVNFTIVAAADGSPDITGVTSSDVTAVVSPTEHSTGGGDDDESGMSARASVKFTNAAGDQSRTLTIKVKVDTDEDGDTSAKVSVSLSGIKGVEGKAVGSHTWTGLLCDNTPASIAYTVAADGTITVGAITPASATSSTDGDKTTVTFATGENVRIKVSDHDGQMTVSVKERIRCDSPNPTTNVSTSIPAGDHEGDNHQGDDGHDGHGDGN
jgi:hypothetical protein